VLTAKAPYYPVKPTALDKYEEPFVLPVKNIIKPEPLFITKAKEAKLPK